MIDSADPHKVNLNLVNVAHGCNGSTITVTAESISDDQGNVLGSASVGLGLLLGNVNADGSSAIGRPAGRDSSYC